MSNSLKILVVEDHDVVRESLCTVLTQKGFRVEAVEDAQSAIKVLSANHGAVDLLFSDVLLPGINGNELARYVRDSFPSVPIVLCSGLVSALPAEHTSILKPYTLDELLTTFDDVLRRSGRVPRC